VAKTPVGDTLVRAIEKIDALQRTVGKHTEILTRLADKIAEMDKRLAAIEKAAKR
jgi:hypothetical protein